MELQAALAASRIPKWDELCQYSRTSCKNYTFASEIERLRIRPPLLRYRLARFLVGFLIRDLTIRKFLQFSWQEIIDLMTDQVVRNHDIARQEHLTSDLAPVSSRPMTRIFRPYNQMPCTRETVMKRVHKVLEVARFHDPILLVGDDDLVSVELALAGFTDITTLDIDPKVLADIDEAAANSGVKVRTVQHDLRQPPPPNLKRSYKLIIMDPFYSMEGLRLFLGGALSIANDRSDLHIFLCMHLMSLLREGLQEFEQLLTELNLEVHEFHQGFNSYPVPSLFKSLIHIVNQILIGSKALATDGYAFPFLLSDAVLLRKKASRVKKEPL